MAKHVIDLPDHVIVSGTASGLGGECARALLASGVQVIGVDVAPADIDAADGQYRHVRASVTDESTWDRVVEALPDDLDSLGYIGSAAVLDVEVLADADSLDIWKRTWDVNVLGNLLAVRRLLPLMRTLRHASIAVVASVDAAFGEQQLGAYASSKGALVAGMRTVALDYARTGVHINVLAPGPMRAGLFERHLLAADDPAAFLAIREARQPFGRITGADEVANVALFLLSEQASALHATVVTADGGLTAGFDFRVEGAGAASS